MRIGLFIGETSGAVTPLDQLVARAVRAEAAGFPSAWVPHIPWSLDALTALALAGQATSRIELGTAVVPTYPRHPLGMAQQALSTQAACGGRLVLGIGPSHPGVIEGMYGLTYERPARHTREYVEALRALSEPRERFGRVAQEGEIFRFSAMLDVPGGSPFPILVAALAPLMLRVAGEVADGTVTYWADERALGEHIVPQVGAAAQAAGRGAPRVVAGLPVAVVEAGEVDTARERAARMFAPYREIPAYQRVFALGSHEGPEGVAVIGTEKEVVARLRAFADAGATDVLAAPLGLGADREVSLRATEDVLASLL